MRPVLRLEHVTVNDRERVGGKRFALATMVKNGLKVPLGPVPWSGCLHRYLADNRARRDNFDGA